MRTVLFFSLALVITLQGCAGSDGKKNSTPNSDAPVLASIGDKSVQVGNNLNFTVTATDPNNTHLTFTSDGTVGVGNPYTSPGAATFNLSNNQIFDWTPSTNGIYTVKFTVTNQAGLSDSETITITVTSGTSGSSTGQALFSANCSSCHGAGGSQACVPWTPSEISTAIANVGAMSSISLSSDEINAISDYVATAAPNC